MKRILGLTALLLLVASAYAQPNNPSVRYVASAPSGACSASPPIQVVISTGVAYTCNNGTWGALAGGGGSGTVSSATAGQVAQYTGATTVGGVNASTLPQTVAWEKKGTVIFGGNTDSTVIQEPTVFVQPNPVAITNVPAGTSVLGMFYTQGYSAAMLDYAESVDGGQGNWFGSSITIPGHAHSCEATIGGTIYILAANSPYLATGIDIYSFASGVATLVKSNIVTNGGSGWKSNNLGNCGFWHDLDGNYYLLYDGQSGAGNWTTGLATCTAPSGSMSCTDYGSNPVISPIAGATIGNTKSVRQLGASSYETWLHGTGSIVGVLPTDGFFATAPSPHGPWTVGAASVLPRSSRIEGVNTATGQVADLSVLDFNSSCFTFYSQSPNGNTGFNGGIGVATANIPCENLSSVTQGMQAPTLGSVKFSTYTLPFIDNFPGTAFSSAWTRINAGTVTGTCAVSGGSIGPDSSQCGVAATGVTFPADQFAQAPMTYGAGGHDAWLCTHMTSAGDGVCWLEVSGLATIQEYVAGSFTVSPTMSPATCPVPASGDVIRISNTGTAYSIYDVTTSTAICSATVAGFSGGGPGALLAGTSTAIGGMVAD